MCFDKFWKAKREPGKLVKRDGLDKNPDDNRDFKLFDFLSLIYPEDSLPKSFELVTYEEAREFVKSQGYWNSCASHAITTAIELSHKINKTNRQVPLAERYHYYFARKMINKLPSNSGMTIRDAFKTAQKEGVCPEKLCPYVSSDMNNEPSGIAKGFTNWWKIKEYYFSNSLFDIKNTLVSKKPVVTGVYTTDSFKSETGEITYSKNEPLYGGHAIVIYGYDDDYKLLKCINSWGTRYKQEGLMSVPYDYWEKYNIDTGSFNI